MSGKFCFGIMALEGLLNRIRQIKSNLTFNREAEAMRMAFDQLALLKLRIQTKGQNSEEQAFAPYVPAYARERQRSGYQVGIVDFTRTGRLWANVAPRVESATDTSVTVVIEGGEKRSKDIIQGARRKRGNILQPTRKEIELIRAANRERVLKAFQQ